MRQKSFDQLQQKHDHSTIASNSETKKGNNSWPHQDWHTFYPGKWQGVCSCDVYIYIVIYEKIKKKTALQRVELL